MIGARADCAAPGACTVSWELARMPVRVYAGPTPETIDRTAPAAVVTTGAEVTLPDPEPDAPRYFEVVPDGRRRGPVVGDRFLALAGAPSSRDLGGYQTDDGRSIRWGRLFRTDGLGALSETDRIRLDGVGLASECTDALDLPVTPDALRAVADAVTSSAARARAAALLRRLATGREPQWVHCTLFDDRVGWPAALVLTTLGVRRETVVADHLLGGLRGLDPPPDRRPLDAAFEAVRRRYGTWDRYLAKGLGLDRRTADRLRTRYVADR